MWVLIDNLTPNKPCLVNLSRCDAVSWDSGTLTFEFSDGRCVELESEKKEFIAIASKVDILQEVE